jgi:NAD+ synthase (glutamine-hydrolysing)
MRIGLAQINPTVGDIARNADKIIDLIERARARRVDVIVFPELALSGYPPEDLLLKKAFLKANRKHLARVVKAARSIFAVVGFPEYDKEGTYNAAALIYNGRLLDTYRKAALPNYGVFDEKRYFSPGKKIPIAPFGKGLKMGVCVCEDIWKPHGAHKIAVSSGGANLIINISSSPYHAGKILQRQKLLKQRAVENKAFIAYCNSVGGQDELVFDGGSLIYGPRGTLLARARQFEEDLLITDLDIKRPKNSVGRQEKLLPQLAEIERALITGLRDYIRKNGFEKAVLGLSGGIDSALTAYLLREALGGDSVVAVSMPSSYSSRATKKDAEKLAKNLGVRFMTLPINKVYKTHLAELKRVFGSGPGGIAEENLQARIRGNTLMALSNKFKWIVVTTGNKSETSVGYCTLYGDTAGGFAALKDVPKTLVYRLSEHINKKEGFDIIPRSIIKRAPTAELRHGQRDRDTLPPYHVLDRILDAYIEKDRPVGSIIRSGIRKNVTMKVISMVDSSEYKRRQSPPGVKITPRAFGRDRRMPIVNRWKG